jgi:hypothetical protein
MAHLERLLDIPLPGDDEGAQSHGEQSPVPNSIDVEEGPSSLPSVAAFEETSVASVTTARDTEHLGSPPSVISFETEPTMDGYIGDEPGLSTKSFVLIFTVLLGVIVLGGLYLAREPLAEHARQRSLEAQTELLDAEAKKRYEALENDVVDTMRLIDGRVEQLNWNAAAVGAKVEQYLGAPLGYLQLHPIERPRELDLAVLESDTIALHWAGITNAVVHGYPSPRLHLVLQEIRDRIETESLVPADRGLVGELLSHLQLEERFAFERGHHLQSFKGLMDGLRFEQDLREFERSQNQCRIGQ